MTDEEFFTAIYLVCGSLPSKPEKQKMVTSMSTMYRRKLPNNMEETWLVADEAEYEAQIDLRVLHDPAYMRYFDKAAALGIRVGEFGKYLAWAEAYEARRQ
jgi:hypothetical protein